MCDGWPSTNLMGGILFFLVILTDLVIFIVEELSGIMCQTLIKKLIIIETRVTTGFVWDFNKKLLKCCN